MVLTFASVHHSVQIADCWTVLAAFALDALAVRDFFERYKKTAMLWDCRKITPRLHQGFIGVIKL